MCSVTYHLIHLLLLFFSIAGLPNSRGCSFLFYPGERRSSFMKCPSLQLSVFIDQSHRTSIPIMSCFFFSAWNTYTSHHRPPATAYMKFCIFVKIVLYWPAVIDINLLSTLQPGAQSECSSRNFKRRADTPEICIFSN